MDVQTRRLSNVAEIVPFSEVIVRGLGIIPPSAEQIAEHKRHEEARHRPSLLWRIGQKIGDTTLRLSIIGAAFAQLALVVLLMKGLQPIFGGDGFTFGKLLVALCFLLACASTVFTLSLLGEQQRKGPARWVMFYLDPEDERQMESVPEYIQDRIKILKEHIPDTTFTIEELRQGIWVLDPIVRAYLPQPVIIGVYDEKGQKVY